ncbi:nucleotide exchange factor GrpE [Pelagicoccus sp. NFK12]|uniref:Protein GrpE n=1 Tax=Pelagicoccus enzymogenes TaxID=2773457 RepID=A0A927F5F4_9BACT|nr:nucleotide exchange factor GrpE [Pelagicoccus enzymogenes]MBD5778001.1 nucleotide exchange factor GrpE [Pelagicoccus enzymogenes]MDQ8197942.1 nucleotide exchange factor GrpE [Pelagicoccus enzymogenes]
MENAKETPEVEENVDAQTEEASAEAAEASAEATEAVSEEAAEAAAEVAEEPKELTLEEQLEAAKAEAAENYNNYLRSVADLDTYRRRVMREKDELKQYAISGLLEDFLPIYDNLGLGLMSAEQSSDPKVVVQGIQMVMNQFKSLLEDNGIAEVAPAPGDDFDPNVAEAFQTQPSDEIEEGKVLSLMRKGFKLNGRLIRPANVVVSGGPATESE